MEKTKQQIIEILETEIIKKHEKIKSEFLGNLRDCSEQYRTSDRICWLLEEFSISEYRAARATLILRAFENENNTEIPPMEIIRHVIKELEDMLVNFTASVISNSNQMRNIQKSFQLQAASEDYKFYKSKF